MIIKINGKRIDEPAVDLMQPKSVTRNGDQLRKWMKFGHKALYAAALATLFIDMLMGSGGAITASAAGAAQISDAFEPVKRLLIDVADPLCYVMFVWGCIECIVGRAASGLNRMKYAAIGYIAINWIPVVMAVIRGAAPH